MNLSICGILFIAAGTCVVSACSNNIASSPAEFRGHGIKFSKLVNSWQDQSQRNVVMQSFDYSCGAAAIATLMRYYFNDAVTEADVLQDIMTRLNQTDTGKREKEGLSLLDLKNFAQRRGYQAIGVNLEFKSLPKLKGPVLVYLETNEYEHFAIFKGIKEDRVFLADPSRGNIRVSVYDFANEWNGLALVLGKKNFKPPLKHGLETDIPVPVLNELSAARKTLYLNKTLR